MTSSGYAEMSLSAQAGNALAEYRGIWLSAIAGVAIMTGLGMAMQWRARRCCAVVLREAGSR